MDRINDESTTLYFYESRLLTFDGWPFQEDCVCTPENVSNTTTTSLMGSPVTYYLFMHILIGFLFALRCVSALEGLHLKL